MACPTFSLHPGRSTNGSAQTEHAQQILTIKVRSVRPQHNAGEERSGHVARCSPRPRSERTTSTNAICRRPALRHNMTSRMKGGSKASEQGLVFLRRESTPNTDPSAPQAHDAPLRLARDVLWGIICFNIVVSSATDWHCLAAPKRNWSKPEHTGEMWSSPPQAQE